MAAAPSLQTFFCLQMTAKRLVRGRWPQKSIGVCVVRDECRQAWRDVELVGSLDDSEQVLCHPLPHVQHSKKSGIREVLQMSGTSAIG